MATARGVRVEAAGLALAGAPERVALADCDAVLLRKDPPYDIDFPDEDDGVVNPERVERAWHVARDRVRRLLETAPEGERLREGALVVISVTMARSKRPR